MMGNGAARRESGWRDLGLEELVGRGPDLGGKGRGMGVGPGSGLPR